MTPREKANSVSEAFPARLRAARKSAGLTQEELAEKAGCSAIALSKFETGVNRPTFENLIALASALELTVDSLIGQPGTEKGFGKRKAEAIFKLERVSRELSAEWIESIIEIAERAK